MSDTQHTPGPWQVLDAGNYIQAKGGDICRMNNDNPSLIDNARLIAAAPETAAELDRLKEINTELLEALERLIDYPEVPEGFENIAKNKARAAIAKARGAA